MMLWAAMPLGFMRARPETVGFSEDEARELCAAHDDGIVRPRLPVLQENIRHASELLAAVEPLGRA